MAEILGTLLDLHLAPEGDAWFESGKRERQHAPELYSTGIVGDGGGGSPTPPILSIVSPPVGVIPGSRSDAVNTPAIFDVTDVAPGLGLVIVTCKFVGSTETLVAFDGSNFLAPCSELVRSAVVDGFRFTLRETGGWRGDFNLFVYAIDSAGALEGNLP